MKYYCYRHWVRGVCGYARSQNSTFLIGVLAAVCHQKVQVKSKSPGKFRKAEILNPACTHVGYTVNFCSQYAHLMSLYARLTSADTFCRCVTPCLWKICTPELIIHCRHDSLPVLITGHMCYAQIIVTSSSGFASLHIATDQCRQAV